MTIVSVLSPSGKLSSSWIMFDSLKCLVRSLKVALTYPFFLKTKQFPIFFAVFCRTSDYEPNYLPGRYLTKYLCSFLITDFASPNAFSAMTSPTLVCHIVYTLVCHIIPTSARSFTNTNQTHLCLNVRPSPRLWRYISSDTVLYHFSIFFVVSILHPNPFSHQPTNEKRHSKLMKQ